MTKGAVELLKLIPAVDRLLREPRLASALADHPRSLMVSVVRATLQDCRAGIRAGMLAAPEDLEPARLALLVQAQLQRLARPSLRRVINGTGVIIHTNLGRSLLATSALEALADVAGGYSTLEYDVNRGRRGSRQDHVREILTELTGAEDALVVNNNAAAVLLCLETLARGKEVVISRGQLVEIGGSFRIPDVMAKSGARLVEVGTTNKTHLEDYERAIGPDTALLLKVHTSNYRIMGFTQEVDGAPLVRLAQRHGLPVMEDLGSGCLLDLGPYGLPREPTVQDVLREGVDVVTFSGDKLLGGPQAGIILGRTEFIRALRQNPLHRALRIDKLTLAALEHTLRLYRDPAAVVATVPTLRMLLQDYAQLRVQAARLQRRLRGLKPSNFGLRWIDGESMVGGGALPLLKLKSRLMCLEARRLSAAGIEAWLRRHAPPVIGRVEKECVLLDLRTIQTDDELILIRTLRELAAVEQVETDAGADSGAQGPGTGGWAEDGS